MTDSKPEMLNETDMRIPLDDERIQNKNLFREFENMDMFRMIGAGGSSLVYLARVNGQYGCVIKEYCFIDGNHENHYALETYPREKWRGGMVHVIRRDSSGNPKIVHLIRGEVYGINGKRIFVFGGAHSEDCQYRKAYRNWWPDRELPDREEMARGVRNLKKNNWQTDFVLTHTMPAGVFQPGFRHYGDQEETELREYLEKIRSTCSFQRWYSGHIHLDADIDDKHTSLLDDIRNMETNEIVGSMKLKEKK